VDCHGDHEVRTLEQLRTKDGKALVDSSCVSCHPARTLRPGDAHATEAGCADCHGPHRVRAARDTVGIAAGCAGCHEEVARDAATDVHGEAVHRHAPGQAHAGEGPMPTCVACHGGHGIPAKTALERDSTIAARCGTCHTNAARSYGDSYHGNAARVGSPTAARCASCHGSHRVFARDDPRSMVSEGRLAETCGQCHEPAKNAGLTSYRVHVEKADRHESFIIWASYMFMLALLYGTIGVFGLHTALWLTRTLVERMHQKRWRRQQGLPEPPKRRLALDSADRGKGPYVWRFTLMQRLAHAFTVIAFFALTITGLPLRFSCAVWAPALMSVIGGVTWAGLVHRVAGVILVTNLLVHVGQTTLKVLRSPDWKSNFWGHDSLIPQPRDAVQMLQMFKWFLGLGPRPVFGRWSYMEKFDYFGSFWGVGLLGVTGFIRWFPGLFASFLPGWAYNVAAILHAEEALLAASFLFLVHFFNVHLRPDVFPLSGVMWTGRQRLEAYEEDHPALAAQWTDLASQPVSATPRVDAVAPPPPIWLTVTGAVFGIFAAAVGLAILGLILWVQLC
jgi:cytochrome b subunit of formate dehydrogenase